MEKLTIKQNVVEATKTVDREINLPFYFTDSDNYFKNVVRVQKNALGKVVQMRIEADSNGWVHSSSGMNFDRLPANIIEVTAEAFGEMLDLVLTTIESTLNSIEKEA
jgi:hypothetical protein